jgi:hypothetical protein
MQGLSTSTNRLVHGGEKDSFFDESRFFFVALVLPPAQLARMVIETNVVMACVAQLRFIWIVDRGLIFNSEFRGCGFGGIGISNWKWNDRKK